MKINQEKLSQSDIFYPRAKEQDPSNRVEMQKTLF